MDRKLILFSQLTGFWYRNRDWTMKDKLIFHPVITLNSNIYNLYEGFKKLKWNKRQHLVDKQSFNWRPLYLLSLMAKSYDKNIFLQVSANTCVIIYIETRITTYIRTKEHQTKFTKLHREIKDNLHKKSQETVNSNS